MTCMTVFTNADENTPDADWTQASGLSIKATVHVKGTFAERVIAIYSTANSISGFLAGKITPGDPTPKNLDLIADKLTFSITNPRNNQETASITLVVCEE